MRLFLVLASVHFVFAKSVPDFIATEDEICGEEEAFTRETKKPFCFISREAETSGLTKFFKKVDVLLFLQKCLMNTVLEYLCESNDFYSSSSIFLLHQSQ